MEQKSGIYRFVNLVNGKSYVGKSNNLRHRYTTHLLLLRSGIEPCTALNRAWEKYGESCFAYEVLCYCAPELLNDAEKFYISRYDSYKHGYNCTLGGEGMSGYHHTDETKKKIGRAFRGKKLSPEHVKKVSESQKGRVFSEETKRAMRAAWTKERKDAVTATRSGVNNPNYGKSGERACSKSPVVCSTGEFFFTKRDAARWCGLSSYGNLSSCANGNRRFCGKHPITGEQLSWRNATPEEIRQHTQLS